MKVVGTGIINIKSYKQTCKITSINRKGNGFCQWLI